MQEAGHARLVNIKRRAKRIAKTEEKGVHGDRLGIKRSHSPAWPTTVNLSYNDEVSPRCRVFYSGGEKFIGPVHHVLAEVLGLGDLTVKWFTVNKVADNGDLLPNMRVAHAANGLLRELEGAPAKPGPGQFYVVNHKGLAYLMHIHEAAGRMLEQAGLNAETAVARGSAYSRSPEPSPEDIDGVPAFYVNLRPHIKYNTHRPGHHRTPWFAWLEALRCVGYAQGPSADKQRSLLRKKVPDLRVAVFNPEAKRLEALKQGKTRRGVSPVVSLDSVNAVVEELWPGAAYSETTALARDIIRKHDRVHAAVLAARGLAAALSALEPVPRHNTELAYRETGAVLATALEPIGAKLHWLNKLDAKKNHVRMTSKEQAAQLDRFDRSEYLESCNPPTRAVLRGLLLGPGVGPVPGVEEPRAQEEQRAIQQECRLLHMLDCVQQAASSSTVTPLSLLLSLRVMRLSHSEGILKALAATGAGYPKYSTLMKDIRTFSRASPLRLAPPESQKYALMCASDNGGVYYQHTARQRAADKSKGGRTLNLLIALEDCQSRQFQELERRDYKQFPEDVSTDDDRQC